MLTTTEETILSVFTNACGMPLQAQPVERVKKIKDYAFVHFKDRDLAIKAMNAMNGRIACLVLLDESEFLAHPCHPWIFKNKMKIGAFALFEQMLHFL